MRDETGGDRGPGGTSEVRQNSTHKQIQVWTFQPGLLILTLLAGWEAGTDSL